MAKDMEDPRERERIAFNREIDWDHEGQLGTVFFGPSKSREFPPLSIHTISELIDEGFLPRNSRHNEAPTAEQLLEWARSVFEAYHDYQFEIGFIGYLVSPHREDSRIRLEGISIRSPGAIPETLKEEAMQQFSPDLVTVDDFEIVLRWD